ncbi:MAG: C10 family peptidase [Bacteroidales bacterium]
MSWVDKMKEDLDENRPVMYGAIDNQEDIGHAWILDAYTSGDMFHCNWGWSGSDDGWYSIDDFSPDSVYTFDVYETACVNVYPHAGNLNGTMDLAGSPYHLDHDYIINSTDQLIIEPGVEIIYNGRYKIIVYGQITAVGTATDSIKFIPAHPEIGWRGTMVIQYQ